MPAAVVIATGVHTHAHARPLVRCWRAGDGTLGAPSSPARLSASRVAAAPKCEAPDWSVGCRVKLPESDQRFRFARPLIGCSPLSVSKLAAGMPRCPLCLSLPALGRRRRSLATELNQLTHTSYLSVAFLFVLSTSTISHRRPPLFPRISSTDLQVDLRSYSSLIQRFFVSISGFCSKSQPSIPTKAHSLNQHHLFCLCQQSISNGISYS
jgi:hypothetical protein